MLNHYTPNVSQVKDIRVDSPYNNERTMSKQLRPFFQKILGKLIDGLESKGGKRVMFPRGLLCGPVYIQVLSVSRPGEFKSRLTK